MEHAADITDEAVNAMKLYVQENPESTNTQLFSFLALLGAYLPESYLLISECQKILGPPDPIHGGPPFKERMEPFTSLINISGANAECRCSIDPGNVQTALKLLALSFTKSNIAQNLIRSEIYSRRDVIQYIKDLLTKREVSNHFKQHFSRLITDIKNEENLHKAVSVLETASDKFNQTPIFPQTISRLYYKKNKADCDQAQRWASKAIKRAPHNSYVADTLGQICKTRLRQARRNNVIDMANKAFKAFQEVEQKAEREDGPDNADAVNNSKSFNNRGRFGFIQVAKLAFEKYPPLEKKKLIQNNKTKVQENFEFFEWYLTYSRLDMKTLEPSYFWKDVAQCYQYYTGRSAAESTSFAGLLDLLNHDLVTSNGRRAGLEQVKRTVSELEKIQDNLKHSYKNRPDSVDVAQKYILSNIILSNMNPVSPHITQMTELKEIISRFLDTDVGRRSPEFYLLVLLLFWPDVEPKLNVPLDLETYAVFMEKAFERADHAKYLRGRYLLPLFYLGKASGLSKWIPKYKLDAMEENQSEMWEIPEIHDMLLPVNVEQLQSPTTPQEQRNQEVFVCVGEKKIKATTEECEAKVLIHSHSRFYLGFTIGGPVVFKVRPPLLNKTV